MPGDPWNPGGYFSILALSSKPFSQPVFIDFSSPYQGFPGGSVRKESTCNAVHLGSIPGLQRSPGGVHGNPLWYSSLENSMDREAWWATVHGIPESWIQLSDFSQVQGHWNILSKTFLIVKLCDFF